MPSRILRLWNAGTSAWEEVGDSRLSTHLAAADPHPVYATDADLSAHAAAADPHPVYLTAAEGDTLFLTQSEGDGRYLQGTGTGLTQATAQALFVELAGDVMSGPLTTSVLTAVAPTTGTTSRVYGAGTTLGTTIVTNVSEVAVRFRSSTATTLTAARWYRVTAGQATPTVMRLYDTTTSSAVWTASATERAPLADTAVGWKTVTLTVPYGLVAAREYVLSYATASNDVSQGGTLVPTPDSPLVFVKHAVYTSGPYPDFTSANAFLIDAVVGTPSVPVAGSGAVRLANATAVAWRNAANTTDLSLTVDANNRLAFGGEATLTGNLGVGVTPAAWGSGHKALQVGGGGGAVWGDAGVGSVFFSHNAYFDGSTWRALNAGQAPTRFWLAGDGLIRVATAATAASAGAAVTWNERLQVAQDGTTTITPGTGSLSVTTGLSAAPGSPRLLSGGSSWIEVDPPGNGFVPTRDNAINCGYSGNRWTAVFAVAGTINTSLAEAKEAITPLDPAAALAAVRATTPVTFDYKAPERGPEWYELPDDPEQAASVLEARYRAAPLEEGARHQRGVVLNSPEFPCDPMFECGSGQTSSSNGVGILIAAVRALDARLTALGG